MIRIQKTSGILTRAQDPNRCYLTEESDLLAESSLLEMSRAGEALLKATDPDHIPGYEVIKTPQRETSLVDSFINTLARLGVGMGLPCVVHPSKYPSSPKPIDVASSAAAATAYPPVLITFIEATDCSSLATTGLALYETLFCAGGLGGANIAHNSPQTHFTRKTSKNSKHLRTARGSADLTNRIPHFRNSELGLVQMLGCTNQTAKHSQGPRGPVWASPIVAHSYRGPGPLHRTKQPISSHSYSDWERNEDRRTRAIPTTSPDANETRSSVSSSGNLCAVGIEVRMHEATTGSK
ncbi:hypothetical protein AG1IA_09435 [Rhizoctonia solani AG-1 IA]|uniref:Uncharacterized protein n=1 Tax=Thanatephorus cucumeris (strain AG1-IA) TaxID=983506 RepID=L8WEB6_THACA|nr:hypothetical protein AG1IA_09435 [Rhizoctonia solani AG-1 IA]